MHILQDFRATYYGLFIEITKTVEKVRDLYVCIPSIPVVTFLAPLASNFEGLKDR